MDKTTDSFQLFTSMRYDQQLQNSTANQELNGTSGQTKYFYMLPYHWDRMLQAAKHFGWTDSQRVLEDPEQLAALVTNSVDAYVHKRAGDESTWTDKGAALRVSPKEFYTITPPERGIS